MIKIFDVVLGAVSGYLINQLPAVKAFPGSGKLLWRLVGWLTLLGVCLQVLTLEDTSSLFTMLAAIGGTVTQCKAIARFGVVLCQSTFDGLIF